MNDQLTNVRSANRFRSILQNRDTRQLSDARPSEDQVARRQIAEIAQDASAASIDAVELFADAIRQAGGEVEFRETITIYED